MIDEEAELTLEALTSEDPPAKAEDADEDDVSEMFARLRKEAQKNQD